MALLLWVLREALARPLSLPRLLGAEGAFPCLCGKDVPAVHWGAAALGHLELPGLGGPPHKPGGVSIWAPGAVGRAGTCGVTSIPSLA